MSASNSTLINLHNLLDYDASKFSGAENQLKKSLTNWINQALSIKLKEVLIIYRDQVQQHIKRFEVFFEEEQIKLLSLNSRVMRAYIEETEEKLSSCSNRDLKDACLLACIQLINHYKISVYGTAAAFAKALDMEKYASIFYDAELNEKQIDKRLSDLANNEINSNAKTAFLLSK